MKDNSCKQACTITVVAVTVNDRVQSLRRSEMDDSISVRPVARTWPDIYCPHCKAVVSHATYYRHKNASSSGHKRVLVDSSDSEVSHTMDYSVGIGHW